MWQILLCAVLISVTSGTLRELVVSDEAEFVESMSNSADGLARSGRYANRQKRATDKKKASVTFAELLVFVRKHNEFRRATSPTAANMRFMVWNPELASMAQDWANKCNFKHGQPHRDPKPFGQIGQNLWAGSGAYDPASVVASWQSEVAYFTYNGPTCQTGKMCGHYTQVVWHNSWNVGCGIKYCGSMKSFSGGKGHLIVCNYGPAGNYKGAKPYVSGATCSACPSGFTNCDNKLCTRTPKCGDKTCVTGALNDVCECPDDPYNAAAQVLPVHTTCLLSLALATCFLSKCAW